MTEADFLDGYDPNAFPRPSVAVDLVLMTVKEGRLAALLQQRPDHPHKGDWALPGGFVGIEESLDDAAKRLMTTKAGLDEGWIEQLYSFGEPNRDPRMRVISVAYFALLPAAKFNATLSQRPDLLHRSLCTSMHILTTSNLQPHTYSLPFRTCMETWKT